MTSTDRAPEVAVVMPVRDAGHLVDDALALLRDEVRAHDAEMVVVDDASSDDTARRAGRHDHVRLLGHPTPRGPYAARETGWRATDAEVVVFVDVRCRVPAGWLGALRRAFAAPDVAVAGAGYRVLPGRSLAARAAAARDGFRAGASLVDAAVPFLPGGNLAVRRDVLETVGGWDTTLRSGGDLVLSGEVASRDLGRLVHVPEATVTWVPRDRVVDLVRQRARYGRARLELERRFTAGLDVSPTPPATLPLLSQVVEGWRRHREEPDVGLPVQAVAALAEWAHHRAHRRAWLRAAARGEVPPPRTLRDVVRDRVRQG